MNGDRRKRDRTLTDATIAAPDLAPVTIVSSSAVGWCKQRIGDDTIVEWWRTSRGDYRWRTFSLTHVTSVGYIGSGHARTLAMARKQAFKAAHAR